MDEKLNRNEEQETNDASGGSEDKAQKSVKEEKAKSDNHDDSNLSKTLSSKWAEYKGEFRKILWPSRKELVKKTVTVIITSLMFGLIIFCMDSVYNIGVQLFVQLVGK